VAVADGEEEHHVAHRPGTCNNKSTVRASWRQGVWMAVSPSSISRPSTTPSASFPPVPCTHPQPNLLPSLIRPSLHISSSRPTPRIRKQAFVKRKQAFLSHLSISHSPARHLPHQPFPRSTRGRRALRVKWTWVSAQRSGYHALLPDISVSFHGLHRHIYRETTLRPRSVGDEGRLSYPMK
jgi:hypothetical protein